MFEFPRITDSENKEYYLFFKCDKLEENLSFYNIYYSDEDLYENGSMYINGEKQNGDIYFQEMYYNLDKVVKLTIFILLIVGIISIISIAIYYHKKINVEKLFWLIIPIIFIAFLLIMPTFKSHDEAFHWFRAYDIAQGNYFTQVIDNKPATIANEEILNVTKIVPEGINYSYIIETIKNNQESDEQVQLSLDTTAIYNPIQYFPQTTRNTINKLNNR